MQDQITQLKEIVDQSERLVFFTGAGVSVASGIPDFRSVGGINDKLEKEGLSPEYLLSCNYFEDDPIGFMQFVHDRLLFADKTPNLIHQWIAELENEGKALGVITQNIDGLHSDAGSQHVDELHGTLNRFYCNDCNKHFTKSEIIEDQLMRCPSCDGALRPDIVLYGEMLNQSTIANAINKITQADTLVVLGTSLIVQPAAGLVSQFNGKQLVIVNRDQTPYDRSASLVIHEDMTEVVEQLKQS